MPEPANPHSALQLLRNHPERFTRQGSVAAAWRTYRGRRLGPYYRLVWREDGRQRTLYLGRQCPLVDEVRRLLAQIQGQARFQREVRLQRARFRREFLRPLKRYLDEAFLTYGGGLYLKGWELRGHYARAGKTPPLRLPGCGLKSSFRLPPLLRAEGSRPRPIPPPLPGTVPAGPPPKFPFPLPAPIAEALFHSTVQTSENQSPDPDPSPSSHTETPEDAPGKSTSPSHRQGRRRGTPPQPTLHPCTGSLNLKTRSEPKTDRSEDKSADRKLPTGSTREPGSSRTPGLLRRNHERFGFVEARIPAILLSNACRLVVFRRPGQRGGIILRPNDSYLEFSPFVTQKFRHSRGPPSRRHEPHSSLNCLFQRADNGRPDLRARSLNRPGMI